ncbi:hypothetical protein SuNHUV7_07900 (plasmid) [Pseudoseohaeicola sp. NH-UV-7]|nr:DUF374 domain-containing protein [Sulfitobacter sp. JL08]AXI53472.1 hypothetical protein C1J05_02220 [Sulfitobacter sp. JL08]
MSLRRKIADSETLARGLTALFKWYLRFCYRTARWRRDGFEDMDALVKSGEPVIIAIWHQRLMMAPFIVDLSLGPVCTLTSSARAGTMAGRLQKAFGFDSISMSSHKRHVALSREVLGRIRDGVSIGIATDGPRGPARVASTVPLVWARVSGKRVFVVSFAASRVVEFPTWDRMMMPLPWTSGVMLCREWQESVPRKCDDATLETLRVSLQAALDEVTDASDAACGRPGR